MTINSMQNPGENQHLRQQVIKTPRAEQAAVEQQNQKAAKTDLNHQAVNHVQKAFKLNISREGESMLKTVDNIDNKKGDAHKNENREPLCLKHFPTPYQKQELQTRQIVNIIA